MIGYIRILWNQYNNIGVDVSQPAFLQRNIFLSNRYTLFISFIAISFLIFNILTGNYNRVIGNIVEVLIVQSVPMMNKLNWNRFSRIILCITPLLATLLSRLSQTSFEYFEYGIMSYVGLFSSIAPLIFFNYNHEKKVFWFLAMLNFTFLFTYNYFLGYLSGLSWNEMLNHPYSLLKAPEMLLWCAIVIGVMIFKSVGEKSEEKERLAKEKLVLANLDIQALVNRVNHQNVLLKKQNSEIEDANALLERKVKERTLSLQDKNKKLVEYTFMNSHLLRAPVSKIQGLLNLIEATSDVEQKSQALSYLRVSVEELDKVVFDINETVKEKVKD